MARWSAFLRGWGLGFTLGLTLALLLAPESGRQLRVQLQRQWHTFLHEIRQAAEHERARLEAELRRLQGRE